MPLGSLSETSSIFKYLWTYNGLFTEYAAGKSKLNFLNGRFILLQNLGEMSYIVETS